MVGKLSKYWAYDELVFDNWIREFEILSSILCEWMENRMRKKNVKNEKLKSIYFSSIGKLRFQTIIWKFCQINGLHQILFGKCNIFTFDKKCSIIKCCCQIISWFVITCKNIWQKNLIIDDFFPYDYLLELMSYFSFGRANHYSFNSSKWKINRPFLQEALWPFSWISDVKFYFN